MRNELMGLNEREKKYNFRSFLLGHMHILNKMEHTVNCITYNNLQQNKIIMNASA